MRFDDKKLMINKLLVICGPTAVGKTSTGIKLAKKFDGEIISADSRQVYKGMDIGTGKDIKKSSKFNVQSSKKHDIGNYKINSVSVWLLDMAEPDCQVTVADWLAGAKKVVAIIRKKNKLPIVVGGTGFYIKALVDGIETIGIPPDEELRRQLNKLSVKDLQKRLKQLAPKVYQQLNKSDRHNPHRLIRKIEIAKAKAKSQHHGLSRSTGLLSDDVLKVGLKAPRKFIYQRIDQRVEKRLKNGLLEEVKFLANKYGWDAPGMNTLAYKEFKPLFTEVSIGIHGFDKCSPQALRGVLERWKYDEHAYARRQMTWYKKDKDINWFDITKDQWFDDLIKMVNNWYS